MTWHIAQAKQQFSELLRLSAEEPQAIYNRERPVATVVNALEFEQFQQWRQQQRRTGLMAHFENARQVFHAEGNGCDGIAFTDRLLVERANAFVDTVGSEGLKSAQDAA